MTITVIDQDGYPRMIEDRKIPRLVDEQVSTEHSVHVDLMGNFMQPGSVPDWPKH